MKKMTKLLSIILAVMVLFISFPIQTEAATVKLSKTKATLYIGKTITLKVKGTSEKVTWTSSNKKAATVSSKGKVTPKKEGTTTITAKVGTESYKCKITIKKPYLNATKKTISIGKPYVLKLKGTEIKKVKSSNKKIATVDKTGRVIGKKVGTATISITGKNNKTYKCKVTIKKATKKYDGYDQWGNGYIKKEGQKHYACDFPVPLYDTNQTYISAKTGNTMYGYFYIEYGYPTEADLEADREAAAKFGPYGSSQTCGYYNGVYIKFMSFHR